MRMNEPHLLEAVNRCVRHAGPALENLRRLAAQATA
jgi:hypothetical protein